MALKPARRNFTQEELTAALNMSRETAGARAAEKSLDPENYPAFEVPINDKVLVYVPKSAEFMDRFALHYCTKGKSSQYVRCVNGIEMTSLGLDGTCPLCDAQAFSWALAREELGAIAASKGLDPESDSLSGALKGDWKTVLERRAVRDARVYLTFPIFVIETKYDDLKKQHTTDVVLNSATGKPTGRLMWYTCSESLFKEKWLKSLEGAPSDDDGNTLTNPFGHWFILNYTYETSGQHNRRDSAKNMTVTYKTHGAKAAASYAIVASEFDVRAESWTAAVAAGVLRDNQFYSMEELKEASAEFIQPTIDKLALFETAGAVSQAVVVPGAGSAASANAVLGAFGAGSVPGMPPQVGILPQGSNVPPQVGVNPYNVPPQAGMNPYNVPPQSAANPYNTPPQTGVNPYNIPPQAGVNQYNVPPQTGVNPYNAPSQAGVNPYSTPPQTGVNPNNAPMQDGFVPQDSNATVQEGAYGVPTA